VDKQSLKDHFLHRLDDLTRLSCPDVPNAGLLVALSGGPDSVLLLLGSKIWADERQRPLAACHLNHLLRGEHSDKDALFCAELCRKWDIPLFSMDEDPRPVARHRGAGLEEAARNLRHDFFRKILEENDNLHCVATGHHRDDQVETVIMRLFRGTGPDGMAGIRPVSGQVIHPLLDVSRSRILSWLEDLGQPWRTDASNLDGDNTRSRLRRELLPLVRSIFGNGADQTPARLAELWEDDMDYLQGEAKKLLQALSKQQDGSTSLPVDELLEIHPALASRVLRLWLTRPEGVAAASLQRIHLMNIQAWLRVGTSGTTLDLPDGCCLRRDFNDLQLLRSDSEKPPMRNARDFRILVARTPLPEDIEFFGRQEGFGSSGGPGIWNLTCPSGVLKGNLKVRNWQNGDRIASFGLDGSRKLSDLFAQQHIPASERPGVLVVEDDKGIIWVVGLDRAERTRLLHSDEPAVTITVALRKANIQINHTKTDNSII